jgi:K(+)-stimulated pyrophosphate-energized sodium pump
MLLAVAAVVPAVAQDGGANGDVPPAMENAENGEGEFAVEAMEPEHKHEGEGPILWVIWGIAPLAAIIALFFAWRFYISVVNADPGNERQQEIAGHVREGAMAYLRRQYKVVAIVVIVLCVLLAIMAFGFGLQSGVVPFAFLTGAFFSALCGFFGMKTATMASNRVAAGAQKNLNSGLVTAFRAGAVMGLVVVGFGLLDICIWLAALRIYDLAVGGDSALGYSQITIIMLNFGMGASTQALFARVGGGIFTKAADVGADLVGKVEAGIPEDDPRNPATIADNVGDNVGDVAGMGADLYESYCGSILATALLAYAAGFGFAGIITPMVIAGVGILLSILGVYMVRTQEDASQAQLLKALNKGVYGASFLIAIASIGVIWLLLGSGWATEVPFGSAWIGLTIAMVAGLIAGVIIGHGTERYTSASYKPTREVARNSLTGPATVIIDGIASGMKSAGIPVVAVAAAILVAFAAAGYAGGYGLEAGGVIDEGGFSARAGLFGVGLAAVGMLSSLGITLATDAYGPIADNAGGNAEMCELGPEVRKRTDALDSLGNTTAATGKGFAIGSAALTALALLAAYIEEVKLAAKHVGEKTQVYQLGEEIYEGGWTQLKQVEISEFMRLFEVNLMNPMVLVGLFLGAMTAFVFSGLTMNAVGRAAGKMVEEVRRQFKEIPGIMEGTGQPDYARCVEISTRGAQREMIFPSLLAIAIPVVVGVLLGVPGVMGLLAGSLATGFSLAILMNNAGGSWDNAKKYIEEGAHGGKGSDPHKAAVVGDTVGDPFKDTSGPSLNILLKLMAMVSVVSAGLVTGVHPTIADWFSTFMDQLFG